ncbi:MAG: hypothetical protein WAO76_14730 [Georgfuchsia sp.]
MMNCKEVHELVIRAQDSRLSMTARISLRFHMMLCNACAAFERQMDFLRVACRNFPGGVDPD